MNEPITIKTSDRRNFLKTCCLAPALLLFPASITSCRDKKESRTMAFTPSYLQLHKSGELKTRGEKLWARMKKCDLCPRECGANRIAGKKGFCGSSSTLILSSAQPHFGEEKPLVGRGGSGTIFFSNCSLRCVFCINWEISQGGEGSPSNIETLAEMMLKMQKIGCHNINTVTPSHYLPHILLALDKAAAKGLRLPLVYNTCGWEKLDVLKELDGVVDIYLPDFKYSDPAMAVKYSRGARTYPEITKKALLEMNRQVGVAKPALNGIMQRGLMIRHLVMPNNASGTKEVLAWIGQNLPKNTYVNLMSQYTPRYQAKAYPEIARRIKQDEYDNAISWAREAGLVNVEIQGYSRGLF